MPFPVFRFRRFGSKLVLLLAGLIAVVQVSVYLLISGANERNAIEHIGQNLEVGARVFRGNLNERIDYLTGAAKAMSGDYAIRLLLMQDPLDPRTLRSNLQSYADRVEAPLLTLFSPEGELLASTDATFSSTDLDPFRAMIRKATDAELEQTSDFAYLAGKLYVVVTVPVYAPFPNVAAWFGIAYPIDAAFAEAIKTTTLADVTFLAQPQAERAQVLSTTLDSRHAEFLSRYAGQPRERTTQTQIVPLGEDSYVTLFEPLHIANGQAVLVALQRSLSAELAPARVLENIVLIISLTALFAATIAALVIARGVSQPLRQLALHADSVAAGDYSRHLTLKRQDELGQLAVAFNHMTDGLADRDRVRDLLGKVVSPEIAAKLLHSGVELGGEEREVTILFCDLRDFTTMSEKMAASDVLALLNRYLDRMSAIIEKHNGVVDKYIGDAVMALFGAPVALPGAAALALKAAREMADSLADMNHELAHEGKPSLNFGIGINTAHVVAGNMGSKTRLNYTVVGDGVNLAARLETLTKDRSFATRIIVSESTAIAAGELNTLRPLGQVHVKGKTAAIKIYSVDVTARPWGNRTDTESGLL